MTVTIDSVRNKGYYWIVQGDGFHIECDKYFTTAQSALADWEQIKHKIGITYNMDIKFEEVK